MQTVSVPVKPDMASKINWTQVASILAMIAAYFGLNIPPETLVAVLVGISSLFSVLTMIWRTWFTKSMVRSSVE